MRPALLVLLLTAAVSACSGPSPSAPAPTRPSFTYQLEPLADVLTAGDSLHLEWVPHSDPNYTTLTADVTLCFAFFGPWPDAATAKSTTQTLGSSLPTCPPAGAAATSQSVLTTTAAGGRLKIDASVPDRPGFYSLRQISLIGPATKADGSISSGSITSDHIVEVRAR
jgi:hypothetical protein